MNKYNLTSFTDVIGKVCNFSLFILAIVLKRYDFSISLFGGIFIMQI